MRLQPVLREALSSPPNPLAGFEGVISRQGKRGKGKGGRKGRKATEGVRVKY